MNYDDYIVLFNTGDDAALVERFFHDDVAFTGGTRSYRGKGELLKFLQWAHDGVREVIRAQHVMRSDDLIFVDVDMDFHATKERPEFPFGHLHPGDTVTVKFFVTYRLRDGKVAELKSMTWPPGKGVTRLPRLGAHPSQVAAFHAYLAAFCNADFERFALFFTDDIVLERGSAPPVHGKRGTVDFYKLMFAHVREQLTVNALETSDAYIELDAIARFTAFEDAPDFAIGALRAGESFAGRVIARYTLRDGLIARIAVRRVGAMVRQLR